MLLPTVIRCRGGGSELTNSHEVKFLKYLLFTILIIVGLLPGCRCRWDLKFYFEKVNSFGNTLFVIRSILYYTIKYFSKYFCLLNIELVKDRAAKSWNPWTLQVSQSCCHKKVAVSQKLLSAKSCSQLKVAASFRSFAMKKFRLSLKGKII